MEGKIFIFLQLHQHFKIKNYRVYDISHNHIYFDKELQTQTLKLLEKNSYLSMLNLIEKLSLKHKEQIHFIFSVSGVAFENMIEHTPDVIEKLKYLSSIEVISFTSQTYYDSLSSIEDLKEFRREIKKYNNLVFDLFKVTPKIFKNTNLIYSDKIFDVLNEFNFNSIVSCDLSRFEIASPNYYYSNFDSSSLILSTNFNFSNFNLKKIDFDAKVFFDLVSSEFELGNAEVLNLFFDIEKFGEFEKVDSGIFKFFEEFVSRIILSTNLSLGYIDSLNLIDTKSLKRLNVDDYIFRSDYRLKDKNELQISAISDYYSLGESIKKFLNFKLKHNSISNSDNDLILDWGKLSSYQHFLYMDSSKNWPDLEIHKYFNNLKTPYEYYISYMNILADLRFRLEKKRDKLRFERNILNHKSVSKSGILLSIKEETKS